MPMIIKQLCIFLSFSLLWIHLAQGQLTEYQKAYQVSLDLEKVYEYPQSLQKLQAYYQDYANDYEFNLRLGYLYYLNAQYETSLACFQQAVYLKSGSVEAKNWYLLALMALQKWQEAEDYAKIIIKQDPSNYYANIRLAYIYYLQKKWEHALDRYQMLYTLYPSDPDLKLGLASTYLAMGQKAKANYFYSEILKVYPFHSTAYYGYMQTVR